MLAALTGMGFTGIASTGIATDLLAGKVRIICLQLFILARIHTPGTPFAGVRR
jgi:hypothetical protein